MSNFSLPLQNGTIHYQGGWNHQHYQGNGTLYWENGTIQYLGEWNNDEYHGLGTLYWENGVVRYEGNWKFDLRELGNRAHWKGKGFGTGIME